MTCTKLIDECEGIHLEVLRSGECKEDNILLRQKGKSILIPISTFNKVEEELDNYYYA